MQFLDTHTAIKVSKDKAIELIKKSKLVYITNEVGLIGNIYFYFSLNSNTYYLSIDKNNNAIILHNDKYIDSELYIFIKRGEKNTYDIINIDYSSSTFQKTYLLDYWYGAKILQVKQLEAILIRFLNDSKNSPLTNEELIKVKKYIINKFGEVPLTINNIYDYINTLRGDKQILFKECLTLMDGSTMQLIKWDKEINEMHNGNSNNN